MQTDLVIRQEATSDANILPNTSHVVEVLTGLQGPHWYEIGASTYRKMHENGETSLPKPVYLPAARDASIPSRDAGRNIPVRIYAPDVGPSRGVLMHVHGGGYVVFSHRHADRTLQRLATNCGLTAVSIGYRLAPENPYPAAMHDLEDAALYLEANADAFGGPLRVIGGESAGAHGSLMTTFALLRERPAFRLAALFLTCGLFDMSLSLPSAIAGLNTAVVTRLDLMRFCSAWLPGKDHVALRSAAVSPLFVDLNALNRNRALPPAIFCCGTADPLLDDTLLMSTKWQLSGAQAVVRLFPGAPHAFTALPVLEEAARAYVAIDEFINAHVGI